LIVALRKQGYSREYIAEKMGVLPKQMNEFCQRRKIRKSERRTMLKGNLTFSLFTQDEIRALAEMGKAWECADMAEVITELVRHEIAEFEAKAQKKRA
jgi:ribosomal protein L17